MKSTIGTVDSEKCGSWRSGASSAELAKRKVGWGRSGPLPGHRSDWPWLRGPRQDTKGGGNDQRGQILGSAEPNGQPQQRTNKGSAWTHLRRSVHNIRDSGQQKKMTSLARVPQSPSKSSQFVGTMQDNCPGEIIKYRTKYRYIRGNIKYV